MTNPILETDILTCPHSGVVQLQSSIKDFLKMEDIGVITQSDLLNAPIVGCVNNIAGIPSPCTCVANIPPNAVSSLLVVNNSGAILQNQAQTILTDKGFPLVLQSKTPNNVIYLDSKANMAN